MKASSHLALIYQQASSSDGVNHQQSHEDLGQERTLLTVHVSSDQNIFNYVKI